jgi:dethiobiotin synthetase
MRGLFFTGTDTGVGKTFIVSGVARTLRESQQRVCISKPVATGASWEGTRWVSEDTRMLAKAAGVPEEALERITPWTFREPAVPPVAARLVGIRLTLEGLLGAVHRQAQQGAMLLVEGVGGLLCPLTETETVADLVRELALPLVVVARRTLGTLNHTLLTVEVAQRRGLHVAGVVISETEQPEGVAALTNVEELRRRLTVPLLAVVPHGKPRAVAEVDWWSLGSS